VTEWNTIHRENSAHLQQHIIVINFWKFQLLLGSTSRRRRWLSYFVMRCWLRFFTYEMGMVVVIVRIGGCAGLVPSVVVCVTIQLCMVFGCYRRIFFHMARVLRYLPSVRASSYWMAPLKPGLRVMPKRTVIQIRCTGRPVTTSVTTSKSHVNLVHNHFPCYEILPLTDQ
jgi:hypothetical protein